MKKDRGKLLTILIILSVISFIYSASVLKNEVFWIKQISSGWAVYLIIIRFIQIVELFGIWLWKKWGVYLLIAHQVFAILIIPFYQQATAQQIAEANVNPQLALRIGIIPQISNFLLWIWAIRRKWKYFD